MLWDMMNPLGERSDPLGETPRHKRDRDGNLITK